MADLTLVTNCQSGQGNNNTVLGPSVDKIVRFGDTLERKRPADSYRQRAIASGGGQVCGGLFLRLAPDALLDRVRHPRQRRRRRQLRRYARMTRG